MPYPQECPPDCPLCKYQWVADLVFTLSFWAMAAFLVVASLDAIYQQVK